MNYQINNKNKLMNMFKIKNCLKIFKIINNTIKIFKKEFKFSRIDLKFNK